MKKKIPTDRKTKTEWSIGRIKLHRNGLRIMILERWLSRIVCFIYNLALSLGDHASFSPYRQYERYPAQSNHN